MTSGRAIIVSIDRPGGAHSSNLTGDRGVAHYFTKVTAPVFRKVAISLLNIGALLTLSNCPLIKRRRLCRS
jgi:hypothetical protein